MGHLIKNYSLFCPSYISGSLFDSSCALLLAYSSSNNKNKKEEQHWQQQAGGSGYDPHLEDQPPAKISSKQRQNVGL